MLDYSSLLTGKHVRLKHETLAIDSSGERRIATMLPAGTVIRILSGPRADDQRMVDVLCGDRELVVFAEDIDRRGEEVRSHRV